MPEPRTDGHEPPDGSTPPLPADVETRVLRIAQQLARESGLAPDTRDHGPEDIGPVGLSLDTRLEADLGLDSLGRAELIDRIERELGHRLPDEALLAPTPRDLLELLRPTAAERRQAQIPTSSSSPAPVSTSRAAPDRIQTLPELLDWHTRRAPDAVHILLYEDGPDPRPITHAELWEAAARIAAGLRTHGVEPGRTVALMLPTGMDYFASFFGVLLAGGIPVPIYPPARPEQLEDHLRRHAGILDNAGAMLLITVPEALLVARLLRAWVPSLRGILGPADLAKADPLRAVAWPGADDIAFLQYTSGSTGQPKGVMLSHGDLLANIRAMGKAVAVRPDDVFVSWLPLYHDMGLIGAWLGSLYFGVPLVSMSPLAFLVRPRRWLEAIHRHRGTLSAAPNFGYELCLKRLRDADLDALDLSCWRRALNGAEPVSVDTLRRFAERFERCGLPPQALAPVYGLAEAAVGLSFPPPDRGPVLDCIDRERLATAGSALPLACDDPAAVGVVGCGRPLAGYQVRIVDGKGRPLPERREGLIRFQGPSATRGYYRNPTATARLIQDIGGERWHDTGDRGYLADGELYLTGRVKDMIIRGGRNLYPYELEQAIGELPGIRRGCVVAFAAPDPRHGSERLVLVAETRERNPSQRAALEQQVRERATAVLGLPPEEILLAPPRAIPKTSSGKLRRGSTRDRWLAGKLTAAVPRPVWQLLRLGIAGLGGMASRFLGLLPARLYSGYAWLLFALLAPSVWLGMVTAPTLATRWWFARTGVGLLRRLALVPLQVQGREHLPPSGHPFVLVCNHQSYLDVGLLIQALDPVRRPVVFVAAGRLRSNPLIRWPMQRLDSLFVDRVDLLRGPAEMRRFQAILDSGRPLGFFPEGTFREQPGLLPFRMGAFIAAAGTGTPVLPMAIDGSRALYPGNTFIPHRGPVRLSIGTPLKPQGDDWQAAVRLRDAARAFIAGHCGEPMA